MDTSMDTSSNTTPAPDGDLDSPESQPAEASAPAAAEGVSDDQKKPRRMSRRAVLVGGAVGGALGLAAIPAMNWLASLSRTPQRVAEFTSPPALPDIQFDFSDYIAPAITMEGVLVRFGPVYSLFLTYQLTRTPTVHYQNVLRDALGAIEREYPFSPSGVFTVVSYGLPYFNRIVRRSRTGGGMANDLVASYMPRLLEDQDRFALEEAVPAPTDVSPKNPGITKATFTVPVTIEANDVLLTLRSDSAEVLDDVANWFNGSNTLRGAHLPSPKFDGLCTLTSRRVMFQQVGMPRRVADHYSLPYARLINPQSPMWMGFADQQVNASGPAAITTFQGNETARFTATARGDYFFNGSIQHLSHVILDLGQFYGGDEAGGEPYTDRVQYMFRSSPIPSVGAKDQYTDGGGPAFLANAFQGADDAERNAAAINTFDKKPRLGHVAALQRSSRAKDGTPIHIRMDGPGYDTMDMPDGLLQPKLQFTVFTPTASFFAAMRRNQTSPDLVRKYAVAATENGLERFITTTRRQNFLVPPRAHRAFPLVELA
jgi:hypothetical protein